MFEWMIGVIQSGGVVSVALLMFAENVFPPIPSELVMPLAGFSAASGEMNFFLALAAGSVGSLLGAIFWYFIGMKIGAQRLKRWSAKHGRWLTLSPDEIDTACVWFRRYGGKVVLFGRLVPTVRTLISIPAGVARMSFLPFLIYSSIGTVVWTAVLAGVGYWLEDQYAKVAECTDPVATAVLGAIVLWYLYRVITFKPSG